MPMEDDVTETSDAEAMRILEEEDEADPAANASATAATPTPSRTQQQRRPAPCLPERALAAPTQPRAATPWTQRIRRKPGWIRIRHRDPPSLRPLRPRLPRRWAKAGTAAACRRLSSSLSIMDPDTDPDPDPDPVPLLGQAQAAIVSIQVHSVAVSVMSSPPSITLSKRPGQAP
jgi:hypothetical protein